GGRLVAYPSEHQPAPQRTDARVMNMRGPSRSISQPERGIVQVITAMKTVNPHCTSDSFQCVAAINGWTHIVQAYCRLPIIAIEMTAAIKRIQRFIKGPSRRNSPLRAA